MAALSSIIPAPIRPLDWGGHMLVFRCECEQVLSIGEQNAERLGECPSCGRILRVPARASATAPAKLRIGQSLNGHASASNGHSAAVAELPIHAHKSFAAEPVDEAEVEAAEPVEAEA